MNNYKLWFWIINTISFLLRISFIGRFGLTTDEAHYWVYGKFLSLSYYDHPPLIGYLIKVSTSIFGDTAFAVRFPAIIIFFLSAWIFYLCAQKLFDEKTALVGVVLLNVMPIFSIAGSVMAIPDSPLALFWLLSMYVFLVILESKNDNLWYLLGITTGLAMLSKYNAVLIPVSIFIFLLISKKNRFWFKHKEPYFALIIAFIIFCPVILWNIENNWASFGFQLKHGFGSGIPKLSFIHFYQAIGGQAGYLSPFIFPFIVYAAFIAAKKAFKEKDEISLIVICFSMPTILLFNCAALFNEILPHWPAMGYLSLIAFAAHLTIQKWGNIKFRIYTISAWSITLIIIAIAMAHIMYKVIPIEKFLPQSQAQKIAHGIEESERIDISNDLYGWQEIGQEIKKILDTYPPKSKPFIFTHKSYLASQLAFALPDERVFCISNKLDAYDLWQRNLDPLKNKNGLFISNDYFYSNPQDYKNAFDSYGAQQEIPIYRNGKKIKNFFATLCKKFDPSKLQEGYSADYFLGQKNELFSELVKYDHTIFKFINYFLHNPIINFIMVPISFLDSRGINLSFFAILILSLAFLWNNKREKFWLNLAIFACVLIASTLATLMLKDYFDRSRPLSVFGDESVNYFYEKIYSSSFPSGHTQAAFAMCVYMYMTVSKFRWLFVILAFFTGFERIYVGSHFPADVFCGALIGAVCAFAMLQLAKRFSKI
ncbi:MAG: glycosyltransferase family 39 protein [Endomicrobium sp.]|jgi:4-amino-4-deoxy-L-arabinose transferase-like glycosyltransferase|nr:glycosyltransferase family 39 protein [Endomicrobium sp.]